MVFLIWSIVVAAGMLFAIKAAYVVSTAMVLPATQGALYVSTSAARIRAVLEAVPMASGQLLVDLGCGDGRVLFSANERYGIRAVGYELNPLACLRARLRCRGRKAVRVVRKNFWKVDLGDADVIFCYLFPDVMVRLAGKIRAEVKSGAVVVSCNFALPGFSACQVLRPSGALHHDPIFIYRMAEAA